MLVSVPKQIYHWARSAKMKSDFTPHDRRVHRKYNIFHFTKNGRRWRINGGGFLHGFNCNLMLEVSEEEEFFDRWANSVVFRAALPKNCKDFVRLVEEITQELEK